MSVRSRTTTVFVLTSLTIGACSPVQATPPPSAGRAAVTSAPAASTVTASPAADPTASPVAAATDSPAAAPFQAVYADSPCPEYVEARALSEHGCGYLTVAEDRSKPDGRTVRLLVVRTPTTAPDARAWSGTGFGGDIGLYTPNVTPEGAARTKATQLQLATRGLDQSDPNLGCPEIAALDVAAAEATSRDTTFAGRLGDAVAACRARLVGAGVDVARYGVDDAAADLEDLRAALGIDSWLLDTKGDASLYTFAYLRRWADHVGQVVIDSPRFPGSGPGDDLAATVYAWDRFAAACRSRAACHARLPDPSATLATAVARLDGQPLTTDVTDSALSRAAGRPVHVVVDGDKLLRVVRAVLGGDGPRDVPQLAELVARAADGRLDPTVVAILGNDSTLCAGYLPECPRGDTFSWGAYLSVMCGNVLPLAHAAPAVPADDPGFARILADGGPLATACPAWDVAPADASAATVPPVSTPILAFSGELDAWSARPVIEAALAGLPNAHYYELAGQTHNVMGYTACSISMRNAWLDRPAAAPPGTSCLGELRPQVVPPG